MTVDLLIDGPADAGVTLALAHGAGAPMDSPFMEFMAAALAGRGIRVTRFEFPYMAERRTTGKKRPPDRQPVLLDCWNAVIATLREGGAAKLAIGGKSMGGRMASLIADAAQADGLVCLGYPFHPPGRPDRPRTDHLAGLATPALIVQGERDPMGNTDDVAGYTLSQAIRVLWAPDGNHDLAPRKASGRTKDQNWQDAADAVAAFLRGL